uniref:Sorting nexin 20 n=1 Tax=Takifugu rubripes TaxID=31033 RepID=A0A674MN37_TAKRU
CSRPIRTGVGGCLHPYVSPPVTQRGRKTGLSVPLTKKLQQQYLDSSNCSNLTTKELQQNWKAAKQAERRVRLLFEISNSRIVAQTLSKYVVYDVVVMRSGSFESRRISVERRYSDFLHFHQKLLEEFEEELEDVRK